MKRTELDTLYGKIMDEIGNPPIQLVPEKDAEVWGSRRLGAKPYQVVNAPDITGDYAFGIIIKHGGRSERTVARFIYQAIAGILWRAIPYWDQRWYGLVMAQPEDFPKGIKRPDKAYSRSHAVKLTQAQIKRRFSNGS